MTSGDQVRPQRTTTPHPESKPVPLSGVHSNGTNERCAQQSTWYPTGTYMLVAAEPVGFVRAGSLSGRGVTTVKSTHTHTPSRPSPAWAHSFHPCGSQAVLGPREVESGDPALPFGQVLLPLWASVLSVQRRGLGMLPLAPFKSNDVSSSLPPFHPSPPQQLP